MSQEREFIASPEQQIAIDHVTGSTRSAVLEAVAGAGKTTTLLKMLLRTTGSVAFTVYNKPMAEEIKVKVAKLDLGGRVKVNTLHGFGNGAMWKAFPNAKIDRLKLVKILDTMEDVDKLLHPFAAAAASMAKQVGIGAIVANETHSWWDMVGHYDLADQLPDGTEGRIEEALGHARRLLDKSNAMVGTMIDFDDMVYIPILNNLRFWGNDFVFLDEAQDTNGPRRALVRKLMGRNGRLYAVGDPHQAIYGFTGADSDSLDLIRRDFNAETIRLTTTYRCPKAIVRRAHTWVQHIQAADSAPEGKHSVITEDKFWGTAAAPGVYQWLGPETMILCRNTKPLISVAYGLLRRKIGCYVEGRSIGDGLIKLCSKWKSARTLVALHDRLDEWRIKEIAKATEARNDQRCEAITDQVECLFEIMSQFPDDSPVKVLTDAIYKLFGDTKPGEKPNVVTLCTLHRSKGREAPRIIWWGSTAYSPSRWARQDWQLGQEDNLCYVGATRAQEELIEVTVSGKDSK